MQAFHVNWTAPGFARRPDAPYAVEPFELLTTALSALLWRQENGTISMVCDSEAAAYYDRLGLTGLWDGGVRPVLDGVDRNVDPVCFWAAGKLYALREMDAPCVMIDTDFIVWRDLSAFWDGHPLITIHREDVTPEIYPDASAFHLHRPFDLASLDWRVRPANTALAYFGDPAFTRLYCDAAIDFMRAASPADDSLTYMVFAEQRLLAMLAAREGVPLDSFSDLDALFGAGQSWFTHVWGFKQQMRDDPALCDDFCRRCAVRLMRDFPQAALPLSRVDSLAPYFM